MEIRELGYLFVNQKFEKIEELFEYSGGKLTIRRLLELMKLSIQCQNVSATTYRIVENGSPGVSVAIGDEEELLVILPYRSQVLSEYAAIIGKSKGGFWVEVVLYPYGNKYFTARELYTNIQDLLKAGMSLRGKTVKVPIKNDDKFLYRVRGNLNLEVRRYTDKIDSIIDSPSRELVINYLTNRYSHLLREDEFRGRLKLQAEIENVFDYVLSDYSETKYITDKGAISIIHNEVGTIINEVKELLHTIEDFIESLSSKNIIRFIGDDYDVIGKGIIVVKNLCFLVLKKSEILVQFSRHDSVKLNLDRGSYKFVKSGGLSYAESTSFFEKSISMQKSYLQTWEDIEAEFNNKDKKEEKV